MSSTTKYRVQVEDQASAALRKVKSAASEVERGMLEAGKKIAGAVLSLEALKQAGQFAFESFKKFAEADREVRKLNVALQLSGQPVAELSKRFTDLAATLQRTTGTSDDAVVKIAGNLTALGRSADQVEKIIKVATDLSQVLGIDVEQAAKMVSKTFGGQIGELGELIPEIRTLTKEQLQAGGAAEFLAARIGGIAQEIHGGAQGAITDLGNSFEDFQKAVGRFVDGPGKGLIEFFTNTLNAITQNLALLRTAELNNREITRSMIEGADAGSIIAIESLLTDRIAGNRALNQQIAQALNVIRQAGGVEATRLSDAQLIEAAPEIVRRSGTRNDVTRAFRDLSGYRWQDVAALRQRISQDAELLALASTRRSSTARPRLQLADLEAGQNNPASAASPLATLPFRSSPDLNLDNLLAATALQSGGLDEQILGKNYLWNIFTELEPVAAKPWEAFMKGHDDAVAALQDFADKFVSPALQIADTMLAIFDTITQAQLENMRVQIDNEKKALAESEQAYKDQLATKRALGEDTLDFELQSDKALKDSRDKIAQQERDYKRQAWAAEKQSKLTSALMGGATAVIQALALPFPYNIIQAGVVTALAGVQVGTIQAQQMPSFAVGTREVPRDMTAQIHRGEMIVPATFAESVRRGEMSIGGGAGLVVQINGPVYGASSEVLAREIYNETRRLLRQGVLS